MLKLLIQQYDLSEFGDEVNLFDASQVYSTLAQWSSIAKHEREVYILNNYLTPAVDCLKNSSKASRAKVYHTFAKFCDDQQRNSTK